MQQNEAYTEPTVYHTAIEIPEQALQLNQPYGLRGEGANCHAMFRPNTRRHDKHSNLATPREHELPVQQQENNICTEDNEHLYDYIL